MFDAILYINLDHREDRRQHIENELKKLDHITTNIHRIEGVLDKACGHLGCGKSHVHAIELAIQKNWSSVLIVEDDLRLSEDLSNLSKIDDIEWDVMMLGYGHYNLKECDFDFLRRVNGATCTHGYIVRNHYYQTLLENFKASVSIMENELMKYITENGTSEKMHYCTAIDQHWVHLQQKDIFYVFEPCIGFQGGFAGDT